MNQIKAGAILSYLLVFINNIVKLGYTPFLIRSLGQSEFGLYSIAAATIGYLTIMDLGFGNAMIRYTAKYKALNNQDTQNTLHGMFMIIYSILGVFVGIIGLIIFYNINSIFGDTMSQLELNKMRILVLLLTFNLAITLPFNLYKSIIIAHEKFIFSKLLNIVNVILNPLFMIPLLLLGYKSIALVVVMTLVNMLTIIANYYYCKKKIKINPNYNTFDKSLFKEIANYSLFVFINGIIDQIYWNTGQFILGAVSGTVSVAIFAVAITMKNLYFNSSTSISGLLLPKLTKMVVDKIDDLEVSNLFIKVGRLQFIILSIVLSTFILFGKRFIVLWAGEDYHEAYLISLCILIPVTVPLIQNLGITILQAKNRQRFRSFSYLIIASINLIVSIPMARHFGGLGCAITIGISLFLGNGVLMNWYYRKHIGLDITKFWKEIIKLSLPVLLTIGLFLIYKFLFNTSFSLSSYLLEVSLFCITLFFSIWFMGMNQYERGIIKKFKFQILNRF